jgi:protein SDA1
MKSLKNKTKAQKKKESKDAFQMASSGQGYIEDKGVAAARKLYPAIELLNDPQGLVESLFKRIRSSGSNTYKFDVKLLMINFVTRLVGNHELILLPLYPFLQRYMGGHQRDVTAILAYTVQACHEYVPPDEVYGILKTIAHNFITERCSGEQMAVGINAVRSICARVPSVLSLEDNVTDDNNMTSVAMDVEAFARDLAAYSKHNDRSVSIAGRTWGNFVRDVHPSLLQGKDRGATGSALHRAGEKPLRYGEQRVASGVAGADLLAEYEANKATYLIEKQKRRDAGEESESDDDDDDDDDGIEGDDDSGGWVDVDGDEEMEGEDEESDDEVAPELVPMKEGVDGKMVPDQKKSIDLSKMSTEERSKLKQDVSSGRVFTASDFATMKRLVEREEKLKRDPRAAARRKRAIAKGKGFEILSDDDGSDVDSDDEDGPTITGVVNPEDIMAMAKRKRMNKAERLQKIIAGREKFESKVSLILNIILYEDPKHNRDLFLKSHFFSIHLFYFCF